MRLRASTTTCHGKQSCAQVQSFRKALLFEPEFPVSVSNAPCAIHQKSVLQPHEHNSIAAEAPGVLDHMRRAISAAWPERDVWDGEDPTLTTAVQWTSSLFVQSPQAVLAARDNALTSFARVMKQCRGYNQEALQQVPSHARSMTKLQNVAAILSTVPLRCNGLP